MIDQKTPMDKKNKKTNTKIVVITKSKIGLK